MKLYVDFLNISKYIILPICILHNHHPILFVCATTNHMKHICSSFLAQFLIFIILIFLQLCNIHFFCKVKKFENTIFVILSESEFVLWHWILLNLPFFGTIWRGTSGIQVVTSWMPFVYSLYFRNCSKLCFLI